MLQANNFTTSSYKLCFLVKETNITYCGMNIKSTKCVLMYLFGACIDIELHTRLTNVLLC